MAVYDLLTAPTWAAVGGYEIGTGRAVPSVAAVVGLAGVILAVRALARRTPGRRRRRDGGVALLLGVLGAVVGGVHAANAAGGLGTGNGLAGAVAAVALGSTAAVLAAVALARARRDLRVR